MALTRSTSPKAQRADLKKSLIVEVAKTRQVTPDIEARIDAKVLDKHPRQVSEAPDGAYNHSNSTVLRALAGLVVEGKTLTGDLEDLWAAALDSQAVTVASETDNATGVRSGDVTVGSSYVVRLSENGSGHHVFRKGTRSGGSSISEMAEGLLDD